MTDARKAAFDERLKAATEPEVDPHQHEWEAAVLVTLARHINGDQSELKWLILGQLQPADLSQSNHRAIYEGMKALHDAGDGIDATTVRDWLTQNAKDTAGQAIDAVFAGQAIEDGKLIQTYLDRIVQRGRRRAARDHVQAVLAELDDDQLAPDEAVGRVQAVAFDLNRTGRLIRSTQTEAELLDGFLMDLSLRQNNRGFVGLDTGFPHLNHVLNGLGQGLFIFAGSPSCGKTTFIKQLADTVAARNAVPVLFFSFEQSAEELRIKTLARLAKVNTRDIAKGRTDQVVASLHPSVPAARVWDRIEDAAEDYKAFGHQVRIIEADHDTTIESIRIQALTAKHQANAPRVLVVIDYLQIMPVSQPKAFGSTKDRLDYLCSELRRLARDLDSPVVAISSENRDAYKDNAKPTLAAFKESGGIEYSADVGAAFWTDPAATKAFQDTDKQDHRRVVNLRVLKNRNGELAEIKLIFQPDLATFVETDRTLTAYTDSLKGDA